MLKQAARDRDAVNADRQELIDTIQAGQAAPHNQQLALQVSVMPAAVMLILLLHP